MDVTTIAREIEALLSERRRVSELLVGLLTHPSGLNENTDHIIAALFDRDAGPRYSTDVKAARSLIERGESVVSTPLGDGFWSAEVYRETPTINGLVADKWQTHDCKIDIEAIGYGEAAAIVCALIMVRAVQAVRLLDIARGSPALLRRLDLARGCLRLVPVSEPSYLSKKAVSVVAPAATARGVLGRLLSRVWPWRLGARA